MKKNCVIIPVFKREAVFDNLLLARRSAEGCADLSFIVVDNGNPPPLADRLARLAGGDVSVLRLDHNQSGASAYAAGNYSAAASILIPAEVVREVGVFAQTFIHYDDVEWCFRAARHGYGTYVSTRSLVHHPDWAANFSAWLRYYNTRNKLWFLRQYRRRQWFFSEILLRVKAVFFACTGHRADARLMFLGMKHAADGTLLLRNEVEDHIR